LRVDNWVILGVELFGCVVYYDAHLMSTTGATTGTQGEDCLLVIVLKFPKIIL
jgi:hypothetical protein